MDVQDAQNLCNERQEAFLQALLSGERRRDAYRQVYGADLSNETCDVNSSRLLKIPAVRKRMRELHMIAANRSAIPTVIERQEKLAAMFDNAELTARERLAALDLLNKMTGAYAPQDQRILVATADGSMDAGTRSETVQALLRAEQREELRRRKLLNPHDNASSAVIDVELNTPGKS